MLQTRLDKHSLRKCFFLHAYKPPSRPEPAMQLKPNFVLNSENAIGKVSAKEAPVSELLTAPHFYDPSIRLRLAFM